MLNEKEMLYRDYVMNSMTAVEIAKKYSLTKDQVKNKLKKYNIHKVSLPDTSLLTKETLSDLYITQNLNLEEIEKLLGIKSSTIYFHLQKYGIHKDKQKIKEKRESTNMKEYGCAHPTQTDSIKEKAKQTCIAKYGSVSYLTSEIGSEKIKKINLEKYGTERPTDSPEIRNKITETVMKKYGSTSVLGNKEIRNKVLETNLKKYGTKYYTQTEEYRSRHYKDYTKEYFPNREKAIETLQSFDHKPTIKELANKYNCAISTMYGRLIEQYKLNDYLTLSPITSSYELEIKEILIGFGITNIICNDREALAGQEIDLYLPDYKIGIEYNGNYWHSSQYKDKQYHFKKSKLAEEKGLRLIHIYEYEWETMKDKIVSMLKIATHHIDKKIYARECEVRKITNAEAYKLNSAVHLQGHRDAHITYGLFYKNELVQLMSFSKNKNYQWEIIRGCPGSNNIVIGGVSKLFTHFIRENDPNEVFSYCDYNKFNGASYEALGMKFIGFTGPDKTWLIHGAAVKRSAKKYKEYKNSADAIIWGSGSKKYLWKKSKNQ